MWGNHICINIFRNLYAHPWYTPSAHDACLVMCLYKCVTNFSPCVCTNVSRTSLHVSVQMCHELLSMCLYTCVTNFSPCTHHKHLSIWTSLHVRIMRHVRGVHMERSSWHMCTGTWREVRDTCVQAHGEKFVTHLHLHISPCTHHEYFCMHTIGKGESGTPLCVCVCVCVCGTALSGCIPIVCIEGLRCLSVHRGSKTS